MKYPDVCEDYGDVIGTNWVQFDDAVLAEIPNLSSAKDDEVPLIASLRDKQPATLDTLDLIEFCWRNVSKVKTRWLHDFFRHHHLEFDDDAGRDEFREEIERTFRRNRIAYKLTEDGRIERTNPGILGDLATELGLDTGDPELDRLLNTASVKFRAPDQIMRGEALESLWDAWERIKTLDSSDKKAGIAKVLDSAAGKNSPQFRDALEREAKELTKIGNKHRIRHSETYQEALGNIPRGACKRRACGLLVLSHAQPHSPGHAVKVEHGLSL